VAGAGGAPRIHPTSELRMGTGWCASGPPSHSPRKFFAQKRSVIVAGGGKWGSGGEGTVRVRKRGEKGGEAAATEHQAR